MLGLCHQLLKNSINQFIAEMPWFLPVSWKSCKIVPVLICQLAIAIHARYNPIYIQFRHNYFMDIKSILCTDVILLYIQFGHNYLMNIKPILCTDVILLYIQFGHNYLMNIKPILGADFRKFLCNRHLTFMPTIKIRTCVNCFTRFAGLYSMGVYIKPELGTVWKGVYVNKTWSIS